MADTQALVQTFEPPPPVIEVQSAAERRGAAIRTRVRQSGEGENAMKRVSS